MRFQENLRGVPVLVTGGAGFIGSHLTNRLVAAGAHVRVLDNFVSGYIENLQDCLERVDLVRGDIRDLETCRAAVKDVRFVWHQAALGSVPRSIETPAETLATNVGGTANVFTAARDAGVERVVYASSSSVYGDSETLPKVEGQEGEPVSPYALSKQMNEELASTYARCFDMSFIGLRYFNVYGPRQDPSGPYAAVIPKFLQACRDGEAPTIFGDGEQSRDFTFVGDVVLANLRAMLSDVPSGAHVANIGAGGKTTIRDLAEAICRITETGKEPAYAPPRAGDVKHSSADFSRAAELFGYQPNTTLDDGLSATVGRPAHAAQ